MRRQKVSELHYAHGDVLSSIEHWDLQRFTSGGEGYYKEELQCNSQLDVSSLRNLRS